MDMDILWQTFSETGDPICYMLYRAVRNISKNRRDGSGPRP